MMQNVNHFFFFFWQQSITRDISTIACLEEKCLSDKFARSKLWLTEGCILLQKNPTEHLTDLQLHNPPIEFLVGVQRMVFFISL